ncbi:MAG: hypothetical protein LBG86_01685 [Puniceicoccales bacterium]|jgi:hypothetical protein|nr:hypothetical protein [Puniceicoccales bacterium]
MGKICPSPKLYVDGVESFAMSLSVKGSSLAKKSLLLLSAVMTILVSASLFFFVPTSWAALPVAAAVMLGVATPSAIWMGLELLSGFFPVLEIKNDASIIAAMAITIAIGIAAAVLSSLFLPSFMPLLMGIILSALAIAPVSVYNLAFAADGIYAIASMEEPPNWIMICCLLLPILISIAFAVSLLVFCSAQTAMLAIFAACGGCVVSSAIFFVFCLTRLGFGWEKEGE